MNDNDTITITSALSADDLYGSTGAMGATVSVTDHWGYGNLTSLTPASIPPLTTQSIASLSTTLGNVSNVTGGLTASTTVTGASPYYYGNLSNVGQSGQVLTTNGTGNYGWNYANVTLNPNTYLNGHSLKVAGNADFDGDVTVKGKSLMQTLEKIEQKLAIFKQNPELEEKWDELRELAEKYKALEKDIIEKEKMWDILKK